MMDLETRKDSDGEEKQWENPVEPSNVSDDRNKEQLLRQYKEAKRRKNNLTTEKDIQDNQTK